MKLLSSFMLLAMMLLLALTANAQIVINEVHYHPVENPAFDAIGNPVLDLSNDVHEFVELRNAGPSVVDLSGWKLAGGIGFTFPAGTTITAGGYRVIAKNPARLATVYGLTLATVLGPYNGQLSNRGDTVTLTNGSGVDVDEVRYLPSFPWPASADALAVSGDFTLIDKAAYQYKGRSLQRYSVTGAGSDPANWLASPLGGAPTPGSANAVTGTIPKPVVVAYSAIQDGDESSVIRANATVRVNGTFSSTASLSNVRVEYFIDDINAFNEPRSEVVMTPLTSGQFLAIIPASVQAADRSVIRYRFKADRGSGLEAVSPRADDPAIVPTGPTAREGWFAYFVTPVRTSPNPIYDLFVSDNGTAVNDNLGSNVFPFNGLNGIQAMAYNATGSPKRVTNSATSGLPRDLPYVAATDRVWNGAVPAIYIENGRVRDSMIRLHGSRYNRRPSRPTYKLSFPDTDLYQDADSLFITDKSDYFSVMHGLYRNLNLPLSSVRWIDWYMNGNAKATKLEQGEYNGDLLKKFSASQAALNPGQPEEEVGEYFKDVGTIEVGGEGPYARGDERLIPAAGGWTALQRYDFTFILQNHAWKGAKPIKDMIEAMWAARGDGNWNASGENYANLNPNVPAVRTFFNANWDVDTELTSMALLNWGCPWDDTTQNHFLWRRAGGKWVHFPWDFDSFFGNGDNTGTGSSIYLGEAGLPLTYPGNNSRNANFLKDSFIKAFRTEYNNRMWVLNNTYLHPDNLKNLYFVNAGGTPQSYYSYINAVKSGFCEARFQSINTQLGFAADGSDFLRPTKPIPLAPVGGVTSLPPASLTASGYAHTSGNVTGGNAHARSKWEIRHSAGGYLAPDVVTSSTTNLTSLPIPFNQLIFGQTYFWRVTYYDANDHPSLTSDETPFAYGPQSANQTLISFNDTWKYDFAGTFTTNSWAQVGFNDAGWASGPGTLAFESQASIAETIRTNLPDPKTLNPAGRAYYFRKHFNVSVNPATLTNLHIRHMIDDGCVIWINGQKVHRYYFNEQTSYSYSEFTSGGASPGDAVYQLADAVTRTANFAWVDPRPFLVQGDNVIAVEVHQSSAGSSDITMGLEMTATLPATPGDVTINEVMADNRGAVTNAGKAPDWVEFKNNTAAAIDLAGNGFTDDLFSPARYVFPADTIIPAGGYLVVWCDSDLTAPGLHTGFGLDNGGQRIVLTHQGGIRDYVAFGPQAPNYTIGRTSPDGNGGFALTAPTPNAPNVAIPNVGLATNIRINEWMAKPEHGDDWFELFNADQGPASLAGLWLSDTPSIPKITQIPPLSYIAGRGVADFVANGSTDAGNQVNFQLATGGDWIVLSNTAGTGHFGFAAVRRAGPKRLSGALSGWSGEYLLLSAIPITRVFQLASCRSGDQRSTDQFTDTVGRYRRAVQPNREHRGSQPLVAQRRQAQSPEVSNWRRYDHRSGCLPFV